MSPVPFLTAVPRPRDARARQGPQDARRPERPVRTGRHADRRGAAAHPRPARGTSRPRSSSSTPCRPVPRRMAEIGQVPVAFCRDRARRLGLVAPGHAVHSRRLSARDAARRGTSITRSRPASRSSTITVICSPRDLAENRQFANLFEIWLEGDHYKWRAMRANGVAEALLHRRRRRRATSSWPGPRTVPRVPAQSALPLDASRTGALLRHRRPARRDARAADVWDQANERLRRTGADRPGHPAAVPRARSSARPTIPPTRWPTTSGSARRRSTHTRAADVPARSRARRAPARRLRPLGRPARRDRRRPHRPAPATCSTRSRRRHQAFHDVGGRLSDHGLDQCHAAPCTDARAAAIFDRARAGQAAGAGRPRGPSRHT